MKRKDILCSLLCMIAGVSSIINAEPKVKFETTHGNFIVSLDSVNSPITVANFLTYVKSSSYNNTLIHRVLKDNLFQGGKVNTPNGFITNESDNMVKNLRGTIAMARSSNPHSATSQYFVNLRDNLSYSYVSPASWGYAVFGTITEGMDVVDAIGNVPVLWDKKDPFPDKVIVSKISIVGGTPVVSLINNKKNGLPFITKREGLLTINSNHKSSFEIIDVKGRIVYGKKDIVSNKITISLKRFPKGLYFVRLQGIGRFELLKFTKF